MTPLYETQKNRDDESKAFERLEKAWKTRVFKLPPNHRLDFVCVNELGLVCAWGEFKKRGFTWGAYDTIIISARKFMALVAHAEALMVSALLVVEDRNGELFFCRITRDLNPSVKFAGQTNDPRDPTDIEPVVHLKAESFKKIDES